MGQSDRGRSTVNVGLVLRIFLPLAAGYFLSFFYRSVNAMIAPDLVRDFGLSPSQLGLVTALYFLTFGLSQLPLGVLLDRYGPARVQSILLAIAAIGSLLFALSETFGALALARGLIGMGVAGALMSSFTAFALWFPGRHLPMANGCLLGFGGLGALAATKPVEWALELTDWRGLFLALAAATVLIAFLVRVCLPRPEMGQGPFLWREQLGDIGKIYRNPLFRRVAPLTSICLATGLSIQGLWAGTWLRDVAGFEPSAVATHLLLMAIGLTIGSVLTGIAADAARRIGLSLLTLLGALAFGFIILQSLIIFEWISNSHLLWTGFGLFINATTLSYAILSQSVPSALVARFNTNLNMLMIVTAFACQYLVGWIIEFWPQTPGGGYAPQACQAGFGILLGAQILALFWFVAAPHGSVGAEETGDAGVSR